MRSWKVLIGRSAVGVAALAIAALVLSQTAEGQKTKGKTRPATTKHLMSGICFPNCGSLGKLLKDGPADDKGWTTAARNAALLNELSYILMDDGRCPDKDWANAAKTLRGCSAKVAEAVAAKDLDAARGAFKKMTEACSACHKAHKS
ncbi:MAG: hypothetical protein FJ271_22355 [Planctomycetes bacterium]|nr:hypothetical protein [Planctomycetota bacterium]